MTTSHDAVATTPSPSKLERLLYNRDFALLWSGQLISQLGDSLHQIGLVWLLLDLTGSSTTTGLIALSSYVPTLLFGLYAGALVDRFEPRRMMMFADLSRALVVLAIPLLHLAGQLTAPRLGLLLFASASLWTLFTPARDALVPHLVRREQLEGANSLMQVSWQLSLLLGPTLAAVLLPMTGVVQLFALDGTSFLVSLGLLAFIAQRGMAASTGGAPGWTQLVLAWGDIGAGLRFAWSERRVFWLLVLCGLDNLFLMGFIIIGLPAFVRGELGLGVDALAKVQVVFALGTFAGMGLLTTLGRRLPKGPLFLTGNLLYALTLVPIFWVRSLPALYLLVFVHALVAEPMVLLSRPVLIQTHVPQELHGRIFGMVGMVMTGCSAISVATTGVLLGLAPAHQVMGGLAALSALIAMAGFAARPLRTAP